MSTCSVAPRVGSLAASPAVRRRRRRRRQRRRRGRRAAPPCACARRRGSVGRDPVEPGREPGLLAKRLQVAVREHEGVLGEIVGERVVARGQPPQRRPHRRLVPADEFGERMPVILDDDTGDELGIGDLGLRHPVARLMRLPSVPADGGGGGARARAASAARTAGPRTTRARCSRCRRTAAPGRRCWACRRRTSRRTVRPRPMPPRITPLRRSDHAARRRICFACS